MKNNLIERYIYAVTRHMPEKEAADVSKELDELITTMLTERANDYESEDQKVRKVLTELGDPEKLAREYSGKANDVLIGQPHYSLYLKVLKIVLIAVVIGVSVGAIVNAISNGPAAGSAEANPWISWELNALAEWTASLFSSLMAGFAWVTLIFAFLYHKGVKLDTELADLDDLPEVPSERARIGRGEIIGDVIFATIFAIIFIVLPNVNIPILWMSSEPFPLFNPEVLIGVRPLLIASLVAVVLEAVLKFMDGRYTYRVFAAIVLTNLVSVITTLTWLGNPQALNQYFAERFQVLTGLSVYGINGQPIPGFGGKWAMLPLPFLIVIVVVTMASIGEIISAGVKTFNSKKESGYELS